MVTAQRRAESLQTVPIPVSALSQAQLENRQYSEGQDLERYVPSLKMTHNITQPTNLSPSLRGSLQQDASLVVAESPFGIYVDGVYVGRLNGNNTRLADVERIEVLRGPQGTLYGRNTLAGAIKFISREPGEETWLNASVGYGNHDQYEASVSAGSPLSDTFAGSLSLQVNGRDGFGTNLATGENVGDEENWAGRVKLRYIGGENFDATINVSYADSSNDAAILVNGTTPNVPASQQYSTSDIVPTFGGIYDTFYPNMDYGFPGTRNEPSAGTEQLIASLTMSYDFGNAVLTSVTGYVDTNDFFSTDLSGAGRIIAGFDIGAEQWTQEIQLQGAAFDDKLNYIVGGFFLAEDATQDMDWFFFGPTSQNTIDTGTDSYSVFAQADLRRDRSTDSNGRRSVDA